MKLDLGKTGMSRIINDTIVDDTKFAKEITSALQRYASGDWGDLSDNDKKMNDDAVVSGNDRIVASYLTSKGKVYIITEWDRSYTTILFADEY